MNYIENIGLVLGECGSILSAIDEKTVDAFIDEVLSAKRVFFVGVGRVLLSLEAMAKRFAHLGIDAHIVGEITEPAIRKGDILIVGSGSGESLFPKAIAQKAKTIGARVIMIGSNRESTVASLADLMVRMPTNTKLKCSDEIPSQQIMTSLFEQSLLIFGDITAKMIVEKKGLDMASLWEYHANLE